MDLPVDFLDAKPFWSALYHSLTFANAEGYEYRTSSIFRVPARCNGLIKRSKRLNLKDLVAREGVEPPTPAFSGLDMPIVIWLIPPHLTSSAGRFYGLLLEPNGTNGPVGVCLNTHRFGVSFRSHRHHRQDRSGAIVGIKDEPDSSQNSFSSISGPVLGQRKVLPYLF